MKNTPKRLLALILALAMTLSLLSSAAWAAEFQPENTRDAETVQLAEEASSSSTEEQAETSDEDPPGDTELPSEPEDDPPGDPELPPEPEEDPPAETEQPSEPEEDAASHEDEAESSETQTEDAEQESAEQPTKEDGSENPTDSSEAEPDQSEEQPTVPEDVEEALREQIIEETASDPSYATAQDEIPWFDNASDAVAYVRSKAVERINLIDILVPEAVCQQLDLGEVEDGCTDVLAHTGNPREGDFIKGSLVYNRATATQQEDGRWKVQYYFAYWDSPDQIQAVEDVVSAVVQELDLKNKALSDYEKVKRIYDYITSHVTYAYEAKDAPNSHNAYGAFVENHCVCQGYALMFYRLALEAGLDSRYISGTVDESHAWNIVKVEGVWYLADTTWDAGKSKYAFFLRGRADFGHGNSNDNFHRIKGFANAYPISEFCYGKPDSYGTAPCYTLVTTDNRTVTTTAENGRAKVLLFFHDKCSFSAALIREMAKQEFPGVDIVAANFGQKDTLELIGDFFPASFPGVYAECKNNTDALWAFEDLTGITDSDGWSHSPTIFLVNAKNQVIYGAHGDSGTLITSIQRLLVNPDAPPPAEDPVDYGSFRCMGVCGDNAVWRFYNNGTLRISGTGPLWDNTSSPNGMYWFEDVEDAYFNGAMKYANDSRPVEPWLYYNQVKRVVIEDGITYIGDMMFRANDYYPLMDHLESLEIPASVKTITHAADYGDTMVRQEANIYGWSNTAASAYAQKHGNRFYDLTKYPSTANYSSGGQLEEPPVLLKDYIPPVAEPNVYTLLTSDNREVKTKAERGRGKVFVFYQTYYNDLLPDSFFQELNKTEIPYADVLVIGNPDCLNGALSEAKKLIGTTYPASFPGSYILSNTSKPFFEYLSDKYSLGKPCTVIMDGDSNIVYAKFGIPENLPELVNSLVTHLGTVTDDGKAEDYGAFEKIGVCGDNAVWRFYNNGTLRISGSGPLWENNSEPTSIGWFRSSHSQDEIDTGRVLDSINRTDVKRIIIDDGITYIGSSMFCEMDHLEDLYLPPSVIRYPSRYPVIQNQDVTVHGRSDSAAYQFAKDYQVPFAPSDTNTPTIRDSGACGKNVRWSLDDSMTLTISGTGAMTDYDDNHKSPWNQYKARKVVIQPGVTHIGSQAFYWCESITSISIPNTVTSFGDFAFTGCTGLTSISIPNTVTSLGDYAISGCTGLTSVTIPGSVKSFGYCAFSQCTGLTSVTIPGSVQSLDSTFTGCTGLTTVTISDGVTSLDGAFAECTSLKTITIPTSVTSIAANECMNFNDTVREWEPIPGVTIIGYTNSAAHRYAVENGFSFRSLSKSIKGAVVTATEQTYTGKPITPAVTVKLTGKTLKKDTDYTVACSNNTNAGKATVTVSGTGKYTGSVSGSFTINKANQSFTVTPAVVKAGKTVRLSVEGGYGTLSFASSNQKVATVTSRGVVKGVKNGTVSITVKAAGDKNHNAAAVTHKLTVFQLSAPDVKKVENVLNGIQITAGTVKGAARYRFFCKEGSGTWKKIGDANSTTFTWKKARNGKTYTFAVRCLDKSGTLVSDYSRAGRSITFVKAPTLSSVKNTKAKTVSAAWTKLTGVNGFQIQYSTSKSFKNGNKTVPVNKGSVVSQVITKLSKSKTYYFRIRSSMKISGKTVYSAWSAARSLKIKK